MGVTEGEGEGDEMVVESHRERSGKYIRERHGGGHKTTAQDHTLAAPSCPSI